jgi:hypothetical protein
MLDQDLRLVAPHSGSAPGHSRRAHWLRVSWLRAGLPALCAWAALGCGSSAPVIVAGTMPDGGTFTGVYFSPQYGEMNVMQNGSAVIGEYKQEMRSGKIQGEVSGDLLKFEWTEHKAMVSNRAQETRGHGYFRYVVDKSNGDNILKGEWGLGDAMTGGGPWNAYKQKGKEPHLSHAATSGGDSEDSKEDQGADSKGDDESSSDDLF